MIGFDTTKERYGQICAREMSQNFVQQCTLFYVIESDDKMQ